MDAVGDGLQGNVLRRHGRPEVLQHGPGNFRMQGGDAVDEGRILDRGHGHGEILLGIVGVDAAAGHEIVQRDVEFLQVGGEIILQHFRAENVMGRLDIGVQWKLKNENSRFNLNLSDVFKTNIIQYTADVPELNIYNT